MSEIASAFVRIRPDMHGFKGEVEHGVRDAFVGVGKTIGGAFAATGAFEFAKSIVEAATGDQAAFAILDKAVENAHASTKLFGKSLEDVLSTEGRLKGFSDESLAGAFTRLVSVTHDSAKAFTDLQKAEDLSRARGLDLSVAALAISKAEQGRSTSLQRYGLIVPKVTAAEDALKKGRDKAVAAGAKFTAGENQLYAAAVKTARAQDAQATKTAALTLIQQRFGGVAANFADTASGQFQRLEESLHQLEETLGKAVLGGLASAAEAVGSFTGELAHNEAFIAKLDDGAHALGSALHEVKDIAETVAPPLLNLADVGLKVASAIGAGPILAAIAAYKGFTIVTGLATAAVGFYTRAIAAEAGVTQAAAAANVELAASEAAVGTAGAAAGIGGFGNFAKGVAVLAGTKGGLLGLAAAGVAVLAGGIYYLATRTSEATRATHDFEKALNGLGAALKSIPADQLSVAQARLNLEVANHSLETSKAAAGTTERTQLLLNQKEATLALTEALRQLRKDQDSATSSASAATSAEVRRIEAIARQADSQQIFRGNFPTGSSEARAQAADRAFALGVEVKKLVSSLHEQADAEREQSPLLAHNVDLLGDYADAINRVPTKHEIRFFLDNKKAKAGLEEIVKDMRSAEARAATAGQRAGAAFSVGFAAMIVRNFPVDTTKNGVWDGIAQGITAAASHAEDDAKAGSAATAINKAAKAAIKTLRDGLKLDQQSLAEITGQIALQATQGAEAIASAISSAQGNFNQIGQTLAGDMAAVMEQPFVVAQEHLNLAGDRLALEYDRQSTRLQARQTALSSQLNRLQFEQQARAARFAGENASIARGEAKVGLKNDKISLEQLRREFILPGGRTLSSNTDEALRQLHRFADTAKGASKLAIEEFTAKYQAATLTIRKDQIGLATAQSPKDAQKEANLTVAGAKLTLRQSVLDARHASATARQQIQSDIIRIGVDVAQARARVAAQEIADLTDGFNRAPSPAALKRVTSKIAAIMAANHVSFQRAGAALGEAFRHGFEGQVTGLGLQGKALIGVPGGGKGGGLVPQIVRPLETIQEQAKQAADLAKQQRKVANDEAKKHTALLQKIHSAQVSRDFVTSLGKNPGKQTAKTKDLAGTTG